MWQFPKSPFRPFNQQYALAILPIPNPDTLDFLWITQPIKVKVIYLA
jgi:hypothetical protein